MMKLQLYIRGTKLQNDLLLSDFAVLKDYVDNLLKMILVNILYNRIEFNDHDRIRFTNFKDVFCVRLLKYEKRITIHQAPPYFRFLNAISDAAEQDFITRVFISIRNELDETTHETYNITLNYNCEVPRFSDEDATIFLKLLDMSYLDKFDIENVRVDVRFSYIKDEQSDVIFSKFFIFGNSESSNASTTLEDYTDDVPISEDLMEGEDDMLIVLSENNARDMNCPCRLNIKLGGIMISCGKCGKLSHRFCYAYLHPEELVNVHFECFTCDAEHEYQRYREGERTELIRLRFYMGMLMEKTLLPVFPFDNLRGYIGRMLTSSWEVINTTKRSEMIINPDKLHEALRSLFPNSVVDWNFSSL